MFSKTGTRKIAKTGRTGNRASKWGVTLPENHNLHSLSTVKGMQNTHRMCKVGIQAGLVRAEQGQIIHNAKERERKTARSGARTI
jgi:hypothetical protein